MQGQRLQVHANHLLIAILIGLHYLFSFLLKNFKIYFMCMSILPICMYVYHVCAWPVVVRRVCVELEI